MDPRRTQRVCRGTAANLLRLRRRRAVRGATPPIELPLRLQRADHDAVPVPRSLRHRHVRRFETSRRTGGEGRGNPLRSDSTVLCGKISAARRLQRAAQGAGTRRGGQAARGGVCARLPGPRSRNGRCAGRGMQPHRSRRRQEERRHPAPQQNSAHAVQGRHYASDAVALPRARRALQRAQSAGRRARSGYQRRRVVGPNRRH